MNWQAKVISEGEKKERKKNFFQIQTNFFKDFAIQL